MVMAADVTAAAGHRTMIGKVMDWCCAGWQAETAETDGAGCDGHW